MTGISGEGYHVHMSAKSFSVWEDAKQAEEKGREPLAPAEREVFSCAATFKSRTPMSLRVQNLNLSFQVIRNVPCQGRSREEILFNSFLVL